MVVAIKALACELPATLGVPLSRLHVPEIREEAISRGVVASISDTTIWRWLSEDAIRPWQYRSWVFPRDPEFAPKAGVVLDLYHRTFGGKALHPDEYVVCADEKTSIQARIRPHPSEPARPREPMRVEHEYERGGALQYLAAVDVHRPWVTGRVEPKTGIAPFGRLVADVMGTEPYASARRVFWVVDNGSSHRGQASIDRLEGDYPNLRLIHLPVHASWLNQAEIYFSILQRKVLTPNDVISLEQIAGRIDAFERRFNDIGTPFDWKFTRDDLARLLDRFDDSRLLAA